MHGPSQSEAASSKVVPDGMWATARVARTHTYSALAP